MIDKFRKSTAAHSIAALCLAMRDVGLSAREIVEGVELVHTLLTKGDRIAVPVWPMDDAARALVNEVEADERVA